MKSTDHSGGWPNPPFDQPQPTDQPPLDHVPAYKEPNHLKRGTAAFLIIIAVAAAMFVAPFALVLFAVGYAYGEVIQWLLR